MLGPLDEPAEGLRRHTVRQTSVMVSGQLAQSALQVGSTFILARLLAPEDFGLIAMVSVVVAFVGLFKDIGLTQAVVQERHLAHAQTTGLFWLNEAVTTILALAMAAGAPIVAAMYDETELVGITFAFAAIFFVNGLGSMPQAILSRRMAFRRIAVGETGATVLGIAAAIIVAASGGEYWALVAMPGVRALTLTSFLWATCGWRPGPPHRNTGISDLVRFGKDVTGFNVVNYFSRNADNALIGWRWGPVELGQYNAAYRVLTLPLEQLNTPVARVAVPVLARLQHDTTRYRSAYLRIVRAVAAVTMPLMAVVAVTSDWLVYVILGPGWDLAGDILRWLAVAGILQPTTQTTGWLFLTQNRTGEWFRLGLASACIAVASFLVGLPQGAIGVAIAYAIADICLRTPLLVVWFGRSGPVRSMDLVRVSLLPLGTALIAATIGVSVRILAPDIAPLLGLVVSFLAAGAIVFGLLWLTPNGRATLHDIRIGWTDLKPTRDTAT